MGAEQRWFALPLNAIAASIDKRFIGEYGDAFVGRENIRRSAAGFACRDYAVRDVSGAGSTRSGACRAVFGIAGARRLALGCAAAFHSPEEDVGHRGVELGSSDFS